MADICICISGRLVIDAVRKTLLAEGSWSSSVQQTWLERCESDKEIVQLPGVDGSLLAYALSLPTLGTLAEEMAVINPDALVSPSRMPCVNRSERACSDAECCVWQIAAHKFTKKTLAAAMREDLEKVYQRNVLPQEPFRSDSEAVGMRRLKNTYAPRRPDAPSPDPTPQRTISSFRPQIMKACGLCSRVCQQNCVPHN
eukprot:2677823-Rhodomonas_salina.1